MQKSLNRESFERKISDVFDLIEIGNTKEAMRRIRTLLEKGEKKMHPVERLSYRAVESYVLEKSHRTAEAQALSGEIVKEVIEGNINDQPLLELLDQVLTEVGSYELLLKMRESIAAKNPGDLQLAAKLFTQYTSQNDFQKMSVKATQLEKSLGNPDYALYAIQAYYLNSRTKGAPPLHLQMATALVEK